MLSYVQKYDSQAQAKDVEKLSDIWEQVVHLIIQEMLDYSEVQMNTLHFNLKEEMAYELAKLIDFLSGQVVKERLKGKKISQLNIQKEKQDCLGELGKIKITETAHNCAELVWLKRYRERWEKKSIKALNQTEKKLTPLKVKPVNKNHFIPKSFLRKYWANKQRLFRCKKSTNKKLKINSLALGSWGYSNNLYSDHLEAYFGLLEGDASIPIEKILNREPLFQSEKTALVGFIVIQRLRNPHFMKKLEAGISPLIIQEVGHEKLLDSNYMQAVYESIYTENKLYAELAKPIFDGDWVILKSKTSIVVLPDTSVIFGKYKGHQYVIMPLTPEECLCVLPVPPIQKRFFPHIIELDDTFENYLFQILALASNEDFLCLKDAPLNPLNGDIALFSDALISFLIDELATDESMEKGKKGKRGKGDATL